MVIPMAFMPPLPQWVYSAWPVFTVAYGAQVRADGYFSPLVVCTMLSIPIARQ